LDAPTSGGYDVGWQPLKLSFNMACISMKSSCRFVILVIAALPLLAGCEEEEIAWLPDSSGIVYRDSDKGFSRYDLATKKTTQLLKDVSQEPHGLAISPQGDQFALARVSREEESRSLELVIYGMDGKEVQRSKPIKLAKGMSENESTDSGLEWTINGQLVVYRDQELLGFYDLKAQSFQAISGYNRYAERWTGRCAAPDGTGVLVTKPATEEELFPKVAYFLDWQGKARQINIPTPPAAVTEELAKENHCLAYYVSWDKQTLRHQVQDFRLDIDTRAGTARWYSLPLQVAAKLPGRDPKFGYIAQPFGNGFYAYVGMDEKRSLVGIFHPQTRANKILFKNMEIDGALRSPDGKRLALNITERIKDQDKGRVKLLIVDEKGEIAATIERGEVELPPKAPQGPPAP
jgi:hypothetical protein